MNEINTVEDLYRMLDRYTEGIDWNVFYTKRDKPAPFLKYNKVPDKCVVEFVREHNIRSACEFGCGEGRNSIYLAKHNVCTEAYDLSEIAIENAKQNAQEDKTGKVMFKAGDIFALDFTGKKFELIIDSGVFHHLTPHRRLQYRDMIADLLTEDGYFILLCFAAGKNGADEVDDYEFYKSRQTGAAFTEERLRAFWGERFDIVELRRGENIEESYMWEIDFLYICLLKRKITRR